MKKYKKPTAAVPHSKIPPETYAEIRRCYLQGETMIRMAERMGLCYTTLWNYVATVLKPELAAAGVRHCGELLAEIQMLRSFAWDQLRKCDQGLTQISEEEAFTAAAKSGKPKKTAQAIAGLVKRITRRFPNNSAKNWATIIEWCIEQEANIGGYYKQPMGVIADFRVAGRTADEINNEMLAKLQTKLAAVREQAAIRAQFVSDN